MGTLRFFEVGAFGALYHRARSPAKSPVRFLISWLGIELWALGRRRRRWRYSGHSPIALGADASADSRRALLPRRGFALFSGMLNWVSPE
jgi:hypothetical protein